MMPVLWCATLLVALFSSGAIAAERATATRSKPFFAVTNLFEVGEEGYRSYRIPAIVITKRGTVLAFCAARREASDWAEIKIVMRRSTDGGRTWEPRRILAESPGATVDNPTPIVDRETGTIHLLYQIDYAKCMHVRSEDDGATFGPPVDITAVFDGFREQYDWNVLAPGPGHGIQLSNGRFVVPIWLSPGGKAHRPSRTGVIYSDDRGATWRRGELLPDAFKNMNESVAVQLSDGRVMLNIRNEDPRYRRAISFSGNGATGWSPPELHTALYDPICFASLLRLPDASDGRSRLLFANPDSRRSKTAPLDWGARPRERLTVRLSYDDGRTWPIGRVIESGRAGYSDLAVGTDGTIYCLFERGHVPNDPLNMRFMSVARFNLAWLRAVERHTDDRITDDD